MNPHDEKNALFIERLIRLCKYGGHRSLLQRYWQDASRHQAMPALGKLSAIGHDPTTFVSALYAIHPLHSENGLGVGHAALCLGERRNDTHPFDTHFRRLIACNQIEETATQLLHLVKRLSQKSIPLDYAKLLKELRLWATDHQESVKTTWAKEFWQARPTTTFSE